jgi:hypothetical protein
MKILFAVLAALTVGLFVLAVLAARLDSRNLAAWTAQCESMGGHVEKDVKTSTGTGLGSKGQPVIVTSTSTTRFCLSADGRVLAIR